MELIKVIKAGLQDTIQDNGRVGYQQFGMPVAGAVDPFAQQVANLLVGNEANLPLLEFTLTGPTLSFLAKGRVALTGAPFPLKLNGRAVSMWSAFQVEPGDVLQIGSCATGFRGYLALQGGFQVEQKLGSASTYLRGELGGVSGRHLQELDVLKGYPVKNLPLRTIRLSPYITWLSHYIQHPKLITIRLTPSVHTDNFTKEAIAYYTEAQFKVTPQLDRMGVRLACAQPHPGESYPNTASLVSDPLPIGSVQIPGDHQPIIMLADRQPTGGYPKLGTVTAVDLSKVAQLRPGQVIRFSFISIEEGQQLLQEQNDVLNSLRRFLFYFTKV